MKIFRLRKRAAQKRPESVVIHDVKNTNNGRFLDLRQKVRERVPIIEIHFEELMPFMREHKRPLTTIAIALLVFSSFGFFSRSKASIATFYPTTCLGGWQHPELAQDKPVVSDGSSLEKFTVDNSAVLKNASAELYCGTFTGEIPKDTLPKSFVLSFNWSVDDGTVVHDQSAPIGPTTDTSITVEGSSTPSSDTSASVDTSSAVPQSNTTSSSPDTLDAPPITPPSDAESITTTPDVAPATPAPDTTSTPSDAPQSLLNVFSPTKVFAQDVLDASQTDTSSSAETSPAAEAPAGSDTTADSPQQEILRAAANSPVPVITPADTAEAIPTVSDAFATVVYTLDGSTWNTLGTVSLSNWQHLSFELPLSAWDDISHLQIAIRSIQTLDRQPVVYLDAMKIAVEYQEGKILQKPTVVINNETALVLDGNTDFASDESPVFAVVDPNLSTADIAHLVKDDKAKVLQDRDGVLSPEANTAITSLSLPPSDIPAPSPAFDGLKELFPAPLVAPSSSVDTSPKEPDAPASPPSPDNSGTTTDNAVPAKAPLDVLEGPPPAIDALSSDKVFPAPAESEPAPIPPPAQTTSFLSPTRDASLLDPKYFNRLESVRRKKEGSYYFFSPLVAHAADIFGGAPAITSAKVLDYNGNPTTIKTTIQTVTIDGESRQGVSVEKPKRSFLAGRYTLEVTVETADAIIISDQDFTWGVLAINTDKTVYGEGDNAFFQMGVLSDTGDTLCGANLDLIITSPSGVEAHFSTDDKSIVREAKCGHNNIIDVPDYYAHYNIPMESGTYKMALTAVTDNGKRKITDTFEVDHPQFDVVRNGPTRIFPVSTYPMTLRVTSVADWSGTVTEKIPSSFAVSKPKNSLIYDKVSTVDDVTTITWNVDLKAGKETILGYVFKAPDISPQFYLIGPLSFYDDGIDPDTGKPTFQETRQWQMAADAVCTAASSGNWNTSGTWSCGHVPTNSDSVTINSGATVTMDVASASSIQGVTINGTLNTITSGTSYALTTTTITIGSTGTLTANASTITLTGTSGTLFTITAGGTFTQGTSEVIVTSASGTPTLLSAATTFHRLKINAAATVINAGAAITMSSADAANRLYIAAGVLNDGGNQITGTSNGTLLVDGGAALCIGGTAAATNATCDSGATPTTATTFPTNYTNGNITLAVASDPVAITTTNLVARYDAQLGVTIATGVSRWADQSGNGNDLVQATTALQPTFSGSGTSSIITFANSPGYSLHAAFTLNQPETVYIVGKQTSYLANTYMMDGGSTDKMDIFFHTGTPKFALYAGNFTSDNSDLTVGVIKTIAAVFNGASSTVSINDGTKTTGNAGTNNAGGLTLGSNGNVSGAFGNVAIQEVAVYSAAHDAATQTTIITALTNKWASAGSATVYYNADAATTVSSVPTYANLTITPQLTAARTYTFGSGTTTINGNFKINPSRGSAALLTVNMGGDITVSSTKTTTITRTSSATSSLVTTASNYNLTTGLLVIGTGGTLDASSSTSTIALNATSGTLMTNTGTFTQGNSTVSVTSATGPVALISGAQTFHALTINSASSSTVVNAGAAITIEDTSGAALTVTSGVLNDSGLGYATSGSTNNTLTLGASGTLCLGGSSGSNTSATCDTSTTSTTTRSLPSFHTYSFNATSTTIYLSDAATTVSSSVTYGNLTLRPKITAARAYTIGNTMSVAGAFDSNPQTGAFALTSSLGTGGMTVTGAITLRGTTSTSTLTTTGSNYQLTAGSISISSGETLTANGSTITLTGTSGTLLTNTGTFTQGTSTVSVTSATGPVALLSATQTLHILTINSASSSTVVNAGAALTIDDASGAALTVTSGVFNDSGFGIATSASTTNTLTVSASGTLCLGGAAGSNTSTTCDTSATSTTARAMPTFHTYSFNASSTIIYLSDAATTVSSSQTYGNLKFMPVITAARTYTLGGAMAINGTSWSINPNSSGSNLLTVNAAGTMTLPATGTTTISRQGSTATSKLVLRPSSTDYDLSTGLLNVGTGGTLDGTSASSTITLTGTSGTLFTKAGTFTQGTTEVAVTSASGSPTLLSAATTFHRLKINAAATVINAGAAITMSSTSSANRLYVQAGVLNDGGNQITGTSNGTLLVDATGSLCIGGTAAATNATCDSGATPTTATTFPTNYTNGNITLAGPLGSTWYSSSWGYRTKLTIDHTKVGSSDSSNFVVLVNTTNANWKSTGNGGHVGNSDGTDILFTDSDGTTKLKHEIERYTATSGEVIAWVKVPTLSHTADTVIYMYYGNAGVGAQADAANTWTNHFKEVLHVGDGTTLSTTDSTGTYNGTNSSSTATTGVVGGGAGMTCSPNSITTANNLNTMVGSSSSFSVGLWVKLTSVGATNYLWDLDSPTFLGAFLNLKANNVEWGYFHGGVAPSGYRTYTTTGTQSAGNWYYVVAEKTGSGDSGNLYINGVLQTSYSGTLGNLNTAAAIGRWGNYQNSTSNCVNGVEDEMRISDVARGVDWTLAEYNNISSPSTFYTLSSETAYSAGASTVYYNADAATTVSNTPTYGDLKFMPVLTAARTYTLGGAMTINGNNFSINPSSGSANLLTVNAAGTITLTATGTMTVTRQGSNATSLLDLRPSSTDYDLSTGLLVVAAGGTLDGTSASSAITLTATSGTLFTFGGTFNVGTTTVSVTGNGTATLNSGTGNFYNLTLNATGTKTLGANISLDPAGTLTITTGTLDTSSGSNYQISAGYISIANSASAILTANASAIGLTGTSGTLFTRGSSGVFNGGTSSVTLSGNGSATVNSGAFTGSNQFYDLTSSGTGTKTLGADVTVSDIFGVTGGTFDTSSSNYALTVKNLTISASKTLVGNASTITVTGNWTNSGTFTAGTSTVIFNTASTVALSGTTTFYNLTITHTSDKEIDFAASGGTPTYTVSHTLTVTGHSGHPIKLRSASPTTKWDFLPSGTAAVDYVDVSDGGCHAGAISIVPTNFTDSGNNDSCWFAVTPTLTFSISSASVGLGTLSTAGTGSGSHTISVATNATSGFAVTYKGATLTRVGGSETIPAYSALSSSVAGTAGFGINLVDTAITTNSGTCAAATNYATSSKYTFIANTTTAVTNVTAAADCVFTATYKANISSVTTAGSYSTPITYIATGTF